MKRNSNQQNFILILACLIFNFGCSDDSQSTLDLVGGSLSTSFPSVVKLEITKPSGNSICTGTFVSDSKLLTAAHCVAGGATKVQIADGIGNFVNIGALSTSVGMHPLANGITEIQEKDVWADIAMVSFPPNTSKAMTNISSSIPKVNEPVTLVGYGYTSQAGEGLGTRKSGSTNIVVIAENLNNIIRTTDDQGSGIAIASGDSGGPMFNTAFELIGVASSHFSSQSFEISQHANISGSAPQQTRNFIERHLKSVPTGKNPSQPESTGCIQGSRSKSAAGVPLTCENGVWFKDCALSSNYYPHGYAFPYTNNLETVCRDGEWVFE